MPRLEIPNGWCVQAFRFTLDPTAEQAHALARHFGARRKAYNWTVAQLKADIQAWRATGAQTAKPSLRVLRKRWNTVKDEVCVNAETGTVWWPECSKEAYADGIAGAVDAYWNWQQRRAGKRDGKRMGFPRFKKKGRDADRVSFTTGAMRVEPDRRHLTLPVIGCVRTHENTRRIERLIAKDRARVLAITVRRNGTRLDASVRVLVQRPSSPTWNCLSRESVSTWVFVVWPRSPPRTAHAARSWCQTANAGHYPRGRRPYRRAPKDRGRLANSRHHGHLQALPDVWGGWRTECWEDRFEEQLIRCNGALRLPELDLAAGMDSAREWLRDRIFQRFSDSPAGQILKLSELLADVGPGLVVSDDAVTNGGARPNNEEWARFVAACDLVRGAHAESA